MATFSAVKEQCLTGLQRYLRALISTLCNVHVLSTALIALLSVYITSEKVLDIRYRVDTFFLSLGVTFPLLFSIQAAFGRREAAARTMANLKGKSLGFYMLHRDWEKPTPGDLTMAGDNSTNNAKEASLLLREFLDAVRTFLTDRDQSTESTAEVRWSKTSFKNSWCGLLLSSKVRFSHQTTISTLGNPHLVACYQGISRLSVLNEKTLVRWGYTKSGETVAAAGLQSVITALMTEFENLRMMRDYRTPAMLRYGNHVLTHIIALLIGPYFNSFCYNTAGTVKMQENCYVNYIVCAMFVVTVTLLMRIASDIEYPFDMEGMDDLFFDLDTEVLDFATIDVGGVNDLFQDRPSLQIAKSAQQLSKADSAIPLSTYYTKV